MLVPHTLLLTPTTLERTVPCRYGECVWDEKMAEKLKYILESSVQRRFPRGLKMLMKTGYVHGGAVCVDLGVWSGC